MPLNVMLQLCKITRASKLFQRNFYLPLLKPLSPKDALRRHIITGKNLLGQRIEHYIPVLEEYQARMVRRKYIIKGRGKKRQRKKASMKYVAPFFDDEMENHLRLQGILSRKSKGRGQCYTYYVQDKNCTLVITHQMERAIRDKDITDIMMAQRSEKILVTLKDGQRATLPLASYDGNAPFYRGEGWTKKEIEEYHHHGKETMLIAKLFEAKEQGVEEWELEMMRMANKRKKKMRGEETADWKTMMAAAAENMDWDKFEEETKMIVEQADEPIDDDPIVMAVDDMEKTKRVNEKLKEAGKDVLDKLPTMPEIPEILKIIQNTAEMTEIADVSGVSLNVPSTGKERFIPGQMVKSDEGELFVPGQTVEKEEGDSEYMPGFTIMMDNEPTLLPGLVMGDDPNKAMFLPGESTITENGELQFAEHEDDIRKEDLIPLPTQPEVEEVELEEDQNSEEEEAEMRPPPPKRKEYSYERPKREPTVSSGPKRRERRIKRQPTIIDKSSMDDKQPPPKKKVTIERKPIDLTVPNLERDILEQEKERVENLKKKSAEVELNVDKTRRSIRMKIKQFRESLPPIPKYIPLEPVKKSEKLKELEKSIRKGKFFNDYKKYLNKEAITKEKTEPFNWLDSYQYRNTFDTVGIMRHRVWKSVY